MDAHNTFVPPVFNPVMRKILLTTPIFAVALAGAKTGSGAGMLNFQVAPIVRNCVFENNRAGKGGAVVDRVGVESKFDNCEFSCNAARWRGGAVYFDYGSRPKLTGCVFRENTAGGHGGAAAFCDSSIAVLQHCTFDGNKAGLDGNDIYFDASSSNGDDRASDPRGTNGPRPSAPAARTPARFTQRLDRDGDGKVSKPEFDGPPDRFGDFDKNGDGFITHDEAPQGPPPPRPR